MKVCLSYRVVIEMERGRDPQQACEEALRYLLRKRPGYEKHGAACVGIDRTGRYGAAATMEGFEPGKRLWIYAVGTPEGVLVREGSYVQL
jgi:isoaspartyl peptidase/L-asparaginase-like protein (Ntn-hydrolase superfamily)